MPNVTLDNAVLHTPASTFTVTSAGAVIVGSMLSTTVTICVAVAVFPDPSVAVHVTVVLPSGKLAGASFDAVALQLSAIVGVPRVTFANAAAQVPASTFTVNAAGAVIVGSMLSSTVTVAGAVALELYTVGTNDIVPALDTLFVIQMVPPGLPHPL